MRQRGIWSSSVHAVAVAHAFSASAVGCSSYHEVRSVADLEPSQRVIVGEVKVVGDEISDWVPGTYLGSDLVFRHRLPLDDEGRISLNARSGDELSDGFSSFGSTGGPFTAGLDADSHYILGVRIETTHWLWNTTALVPMLVRIPPARGRCEYIGTIYVRNQGRHLEYMIRDEFDQRGSALASRVEGCEIERNLASVVREPSNG